MSSHENEPNPYAPPETEDLLRDAMEYRDHFEDEEEFQEALALWPVCPECGRRRVTTCPICKVTGNLFPLADADYWFAVAPESNESGTPAPGHECHCQGGDHSCQCNVGAPAAPLPNTDFLKAYVPDASKTEAQPPSEEPTGPDPNDQNTIPSLMRGELQPGLFALAQNPMYLVQQTPGGDTAISVTNDRFSLGLLGQLGGKDESAPGVPKKLRLLSCYVCSEPFEPHFPRRCEWCGHVFEEDAAAPDQDTNEEDAPPLMTRPEDETSSSIAVVFFILALLFALSLGYLWFLFQ